MNLKNNNTDSDSVITIADDSLQDLSILSMHDDLLTYTTTGEMFNSAGIDVNSTFDIDPEITIGKHSLNEHTLEKLLAVLDIMESDPDWSKQINTHIAFNKLKGD